MIAIMAASGNVGSKVADLLLQDGQDVRSSGDRRNGSNHSVGGAEIVVGDAMRVR